MKKCKGAGKAKGKGCGQMVPTQLYGKTNRVYGLGISCGCYRDWLLNTPEGKEKVEKTKIKASKKVKEKPKRKYTRWQDKPTKDMISYVQDELCNPYIRLRDIESGYRCISSGGVIEHAGHCFAVGSAPGLRFNIMNIHGQRGMENVHKHGDFQNYKEGLINRYGVKYFEKLEQLKVKANKIKQLDRQEVIRIGITYKWLLDNKVWCFHYDEFENYKNILNK